MSVRIDVEQVRSVLEGPVYRVRTAVIYNQGIDRRIFVFVTDTETFAHVASPWDLENIPASREAALSLGIDYYRLEEVTRDGDEIEEALDYATYTLARISSLTQAYELAVDQFAGAATSSYTGS